MTPDRPAKRRNETRELVLPILASLNRLQGVRVWRPHVLATSARSVSGAGLCVGSADLIGLITCPNGFARFFALEVKWPGKKPTADQRLWAEVVRKLGGFWCVVHSEVEAGSAVTRCRAGERE